MCKYRRVLECLRLYVACSVSSAAAAAIISAATAPVVAGDGNGDGDDDDVDDVNTLMRLRFAEVF